MKFEVFGPYFLNTKTIIKKEHVAAMREAVAISEYGGILSTAPGCYVFGIKSSGAQRIIPWYVGKAERQPIMKEATNDQHLQLYNEILDDYKNGNPALYFLPSTTPKGRATTLAEAGGKTSDRVLRGLVDRCVPEDEPWALERKKNPLVTRAVRQRNFQSIAGRFKYARRFVQEMHRGLDKVTHVRYWLHTPEPPFRLKFQNLQPR